MIDELISEITHEYQMTTVINTHDMNSVMAIGETVSFIFEGKLWWKGTKEEVLHTDNEELNNFVYASKFAQQLRNTQ